MLEEITIKNFKSIADDTISLGRVNVFIGENGSGKSNILEALMFASVAETYSTIDTDILFTHGVRVSKPSLILSSFEGKKQQENIEINLKFSDSEVKYRLKPENKNDILSKWKLALSDLHSDIAVNNNELAEDLIPVYVNREKYFKQKQNLIDLNKFIIYTLNTEALRGIPEFQRSRKGIYGETLDILVGELNKEQLEELKEYLYTITWLDDIFIDNKDELKQKGYKLNQSKSLLYFKDKYMMKKNNIFSVENANEGVLHVLFYLALLINSKTPRLFAIDNIVSNAYRDYNY